MPTRPWPQKRGTPQLPGDDMIFTLLFLKALGTSHLGDQGGGVNVFPKFSLSWQGSQHNCETKMPRQAGSAVLFLMIKTETPEAPRPPRSVLRDHKEDALAPGPQVV